MSPWLPLSFSERGPGGEAPRQGVFTSPVDVFSDFR
jgi:hypothetical protein